MRQDYDLAFILKYENVAWYEGGTVKILDRRIYPTRVKFVNCSKHEEVAQALTDMVTQSAGPYTATGMGMALAAYECRHLSINNQKAFLKTAAYKFVNARPTTASRIKLIVNRCLKVAEKALNENKKVDEAIFHDTIASLNRRYARMEQVAKYLVDMFPQDGNIMTQCFGETIVGMMLRETKKRHKNIKLFVPETRPYLQGARLTSSVSIDQGIDTTVITDNMVAHTMKEKQIALFTSAADSICLDGNIVNKVGTFQIAIVAKHFGIPYFVTGIPDNTTLDKVTIEERNPLMVLECHGIRHTKENVKGYYPAFDITPPHLISGIVTDKGIFSAYDLNRYFETDVKEFY